MIPVPAYNMMLFSISLHAQIVDNCTFFWEKFGLAPFLLVISNNKEITDSWNSNNNNNPNNRKICTSRGVAVGAQLGTCIS